MSDQMLDGRRFRILAVVDDATRECLALVADTSLWSVHAAALHGSSHYDLPVLRWFTANVGIHHVHHLVSRIPFYRLEEVLRAYPEMRDVERLSIGQSLRCVRLVLWDAERRKLVAFADMGA